jgi:hypothetical protein
LLLLLLLLRAWLDCLEVSDVFLGGTVIEYLKRGKGDPAPFCTTCWAATSLCFFGLIQKSEHWNRTVTETRTGGEKGAACLFSILQTPQIDRFQFEDDYSRFGGTCASIAFK